MKSDDCQKLFSQFSNVIPENINNVNNSLRHKLIKINKQSIYS